GRFVGGCSFRTHDWCGRECSRVSVWPSACDSRAWPNSKSQLFQFSSVSSVSSVVRTLRVLRGSKLLLLNFLLPAEGPLWRVAYCLLRVLRGSGFCFLH